MRLRRAPTATAGRLDLDHIARRQLHLRAGAEQLDAALSAVACEPWSMAEARGFWRARGEDLVDEIRDNVRLSRRTDTDARKIVERR